MGTPGAAIAALEEARPLMPGISAIYDTDQWAVAVTAVGHWMAAALDEGGDLEAAARLNEGLSQEGSALPAVRSAATYRLADLYERLGRLADARRACSIVAEVWKDADPQLQPFVEHALTRLTALAPDG